jgi:NADH-quinone oxidoreductase subunit J
MTLETGLFYLLSFGIIASALGVITSRTAAYGVLWLVSTMCFTAGLFILLKAFLLAAIQLLVYAGAVLVLFLFVVMLLDPAAYASPPSKKRGILAFLIAALFFCQTAFIIYTLKVPTEAALNGTAQNLGRILFTRYALPFELTALLVLAAVVSVVVLAKRPNS